MTLEWEPNCQGKRKKYFKGRSEADCKAQVEAWAQEQFEYFRKLLEKEME